MFRALALRWTNWVGCGLENEGWADGGGMLKAGVSSILWRGWRSSSLRENMGKYAITRLKASHHQSL